uniref:Uncharacterized protein n=1 Tax=Rubinisphaera brasiliensis (strain ATCC 49424 / DSM 5305 / JCM 21570 / IAM 15109 / NBRC 103401 / IFAM 1448) TaxID=756272 RepID=F0SKR4_RUBBR|nr:hypothetical protein Plabr_1117 [Rubinisphaera brasiliensis DSM 5305]
MRKKRTKPVFIKIVHPRLHDEITEEQTEELRRIYLHVGRAFYRNTFEEFERRFLFVKDIDREIRWWSAMSSVLQRCLRRFPHVDSDVLAIEVVCISLCGGADETRIPTRAIRYLKANVPSRSSFIQPTN